MKSLLGWHFNSILDENKQLATIEASKPVIVKGLQFNRNFWIEARKRSPTTKFVGRMWIKDQDYDDPWKIYNAVMSCGCFDLFDYWECYNEPNTHSPGVMRRACECNITFANLIHSAGGKVMGGSFGVGHPPLWWINDNPADPPPYQPPPVNAKHLSTYGPFLDFLRVVDATGVHEYWWPTLTSPEMLDDEHPGEGWRPLRFTKWYYKLPLDCQKPIAVLECGRDSGVIGSSLAGWKNSRATAKEYVKELVAYAYELKKHPCIIGATPYCCYVKDQENWSTFDMMGEAEYEQINYMKSQMGTGVSYTSQYIKLPQTENVFWAYYYLLREYIDKFRVTLGQSADDAVKIHGDLGHVITVVNPKSGDLEYMQGLADPGTKFDVVVGLTQTIREEFLDRVKKGIR